MSGVAVSVRRSVGLYSAAHVCVAGHAILPLVSVIEPPVPGCAVTCAISAVCRFATDVAILVDVAVDALDPSRPGVLPERPPLALPVVGRHRLRQGRPRPCEPQSIAVVREPGRVPQHRLEQVLRAVHHRSNPGLQRHPGEPRAGPCLQHRRRHAVGHPVHLHVEHRQDVSDARLDHVDEVVRLGLRVVGRPARRPDVVRTDRDPRERRLRVVEGERGIRVLAALRRLQDREVNTVARHRRPRDRAPGSARRRSRARGRRH